MLNHEPIPADFEVQPLTDTTSALDPVTCGHCGLTWDDGVSTGRTPTPAGRCPFEYFHTYSDEDNQAEAQQQLKSRLEDLQRFNALTDEYEFNHENRNAADDYAKADLATLDELGDPYEYGLSLEVESISPRWATKTYAWVLSTGDPHEEFQITVEPDDTISSVQFVSLPWFDRIEIRLTHNQAAIVEEFANRFLYLSYEDVTA